MNNPTPFDDLELHAFVDGKLPPARHAEIEALLAADGAAAQRVARYRRQNALLRAALQPILEEAVPGRLRLASRRPQRTAWLRHAALFAALSSAGLLGWMLRSMMPAVAWNEALAQRAATAYLVYTPEQVHPVEVGAQQEEHLVTWLSKRLGSPLRVPHLAAAGYHLVGGRLLPGRQHPAAQFMFENAQGQRLTLYIESHREASPETAFRYVRSDAVSTFYWIDGAFGYALSGDVARAQLLAVAAIVYRDINR